ncbi:hypothetical protein GCM10020221_24420 [Streptomyces thioluteus]|uniref:tRNA methyltransferase TRMD/TRM10-type domain-containing protein n=1 Tax=Streptomyces thioluteus TaxID=66431 RepID=A0ABN3WU18_STRTU
MGKARARGRLDVRIHDLRNWTHDKHNTVDDTPYGGGPGMVMKPEPWGEALDEIIASGPETSGPCWSSRRPAAGRSPRNWPSSCPASRISHVSESLLIHRANGIGDNYVTVSKKNMRDSAHKCDIS